jgi:hypothetical protein
MKMFDISTINKRYFGIKLTITDDEDKERSIEIEVEPPKVKVLKNLMKVRKTANEDAMNELSEAIRKMLSKNKANYIVPIEYIDELDSDQMVEILNAYFEWLGKEKNSKN